MADFFSGVGDFFTHTIPSTVSDLYDYNRSLAESILGVAQGAGKTAGAIGDFLADWLPYLVLAGIAVSALYILSR